MTLSKFVASQLGNPTGLFGSFAGFLWNRRNAALNDTVFNLLELQPTDRVLDIGFGGGYLLNRMLSVVTDGLLAGVDVSPSMVEYSKKYNQTAVKAGRLDLKCAPVESLPYPAAYFTKVCSVNSIFYWQNITKGFDEIKKVLVPGGKAVLCFTCKSSLKTRGFANYLQILDDDEIGKMLTERGFQNTKVMPFADKYRQYICLTARSGVQL